MKNSEEKGKKPFKVNPGEFIPELDLNRGFYNEIVKDIFDSKYPGLTYASGLLGHCSGCLGFDTIISTDHGWGPRLQIFLKEDDYRILKAEMHEMLSNELPLKYRGFPTNQYQGCWGMEEVDKGPVNHWIEIDTVEGFFNRDIDWNCKNPPTTHEWLSFTDQGLCELTSGEIFHDSFGEITEARKRISYYPDGVWYFKMWCLWSAIAEEDAFVGRCNDLEDFVGERLITCRIVNKLMRLCFLLERRYYPYSKWFGTAFKKLNCGQRLGTIISTILSGHNFDKRNQALCDLYEEVGKMHNQLEITMNIGTDVVNYHGRPYKGMDSEPFCNALERLLADALGNYDWKLLSKTVLYDESYFGSYKDEMKKITDTARKEEGEQKAKTGG